MARLMSVTLTEQAVVDRRKTETRRLGWRHVRVGDHLQLCRKVMGRNRADGSVEPLVRLCMVEVVEVRREPLDAITDDAVLREGFSHAELADWWHDGGSLGVAFVRFFCDAMRCTPATEVTVITWRYIDA